MEKSAFPSRRSAWAIKKMTTFSAVHVASYRQHLPVYLPSIFPCKVVRGYLECINLLRRYHFIDAPVSGNTEFMHSPLSSLRIKFISERINVAMGTLNMYRIRCAYKDMNMKL